MRWNRAAQRAGEAAAKRLEQEARLLEAVAEKEPDKRVARQLIQGAASRRAGAAELRKG
ncbi:hypothetical protein [Nonomuraea sp. NPDC050310]|uniref:hypothetical protein n=1 Tax=Nonomuraea sp. NPDC050310 TaxID=3154935 RepID=UPI0033F40173